MGTIKRMLSEKEIKPASDIYNTFHAVEHCENFQIHWRNLRLVFDIPEFEQFVTKAWTGYQRWVESGRPKFGPKEGRITGLDGGMIDAEHGFLGNVLAIEEQTQKDYIQVHYKSMRLDLSKKEFLEMADAFTEAAANLRGDA